MVGPSQSITQLLWFDRQGRAVGKIGSGEPGHYINPEISPDGKRVAVGGFLERESLEGAAKKIHDPDIAIVLHAPIDCEASPIMRDSGRMKHVPIGLANTLDGFPGTIKPGQLPAGRPT